ncbi:MAG: hypothetical protein HYX72_05020 [Acidobacteria bacterium]|nr:hypothetical protein [Acidobacteriota bacterium]
MSVSSFPRPEHIPLLRKKIQEQLQSLGQALEIAERGLNQLKCQYKFGFRSAPEDEWIELGIHFQVADRLENSGNESELSRILDEFLQRHFSNHQIN